MKVKSMLGLLLTGLLSTAIHAECMYPKAPTAPLPDGASASKDEMLAGMKTVKEYRDEVTAYLSCLDLKAASDIAAQGANPAPEAVEQINAMTAKKHDAALDVAEAFAGRFNEQVKIFKARTKS